MRLVKYVLCFIILCSSVYAAEPKVYPQTGVNVFLGLDDNSAPTQVIDGRAQDLQNVIGTNGTDIPIQYNGTTLANVSFTGLANSIQKAKTVAFFKNYLVFGNTTENNIAYPTRIRW